MPIGVSPASNRGVRNSDTPIIQRVFRYFLRPAIGVSEILTPLSVSIFFRYFLRPAKGVSEILTPLSFSIFFRYFLRPAIGVSEILTNLSVSIFFRYFLWPEIGVSEILAPLSFSVFLDIFQIFPLPSGQQFVEHYCFVSISSQKIRFLYKTGDHVAFFPFFIEFCRKFQFWNISKQLGTR